MFGLADFVGGLLLAKQAQTIGPTDAEREEWRRNSEAFRREREAKYDAARERMRLERPKVYKLATKCPHCTSHDYQTHNRRAQCAYCRIPAAQQPARHDPRNSDNAYHRYQQEAMRNIAQQRYYNPY